MAAGSGFGELCSILSAVSWAVGVIFYRQLGATLPPLQLNFLKNLLVMGMLVPAIIAVHGLHPSPLSIPQIVVSVASGVLEAQPLLWVTGWRMLGALLGMAAIALLRGEGRYLFPAASGIPWARLVLAAFLGQFLAMLLWLAGYKYTLASVAAILNETASVFILVLAAIWLKEPLTRRAAIGVMLTLGGVSVMLWLA
ncbi:hypothetical protein BH11PSE14_BH11PSE14_04840 [soil metagenome]